MAKLILCVAMVAALFSMGEAKMRSEISVEQKALATVQSAIQAMTDQELGQILRDSLVEGERLVMQDYLKHMTRAQLHKLAKLGGKSYMNQHMTKEQAAKWSSLSGYAASADNMLTSMGVQQENGGLLDIAKTKAMAAVKDPAIQASAAKMAGSAFKSIGKVFRRF